MEMTMKMTKVEYVPGIPSSLEHARAAAKISVSDTPTGVRILVRRNQTVVVALAIRGVTAAQRAQVIAHVRGRLMAGELDKELLSWYQIKKAYEAKSGEKA